MGLNPAGVTKQMNKSSHPLMHLLFMSALVLLMFAAVAVLTAAATAAGLDPGANPGFYLTQSLTQICVFLLPVLITTRRYYSGSQRAFYRLEAGSHSGAAVLGGIALLLLLTPLIDRLTQWNDSWQLGAFGERCRALQNQTEGLLGRVFSATGIGGLTSNLVVVALLPAVCEEVFFRAGVQNLLQRWLRNPHAAVWAAAAVFSLGHGELFAFVPRLLMGALLGYIYIGGGSLLANTATHFFNNALIVVLYWLNARGTLGFNPETPLQIHWLPTLLCTAVALVVAVRLWKRRPLPAADSPKEC